MRPLVLAVSLIAVMLAVVQPATTADAAATPTHSLAVTGTGVAMYPPFDPDVERYAVTLTGAASTLTVRAASSEAGSTVRINGSPARGGTRTLPGLRPGDEISVLITDSAGTAVHSLFVTPTGFPTLERVDVGAGAGDVAPGHVLLTLSTWAGGAPFFETAVDDNGVPVFARQSANSMDLKRQPTGDLTVSRATTSDGRDGSAMTVLDDRFDEVSRHETVGLVNTDGHDSLLLDDGSRYLLAYEQDKTSGLTDSVIQHVGTDGTVLWEWNSADHVDPASEAVVDVATNKDYAHINSIQIMPDGDVLASFRHFSSVFKIARRDHDGFSSGDVVWKLGGRDSDFRFVDQHGAELAGDGGPCAQHTASVVSGGHILLFDNGSWNVNNGQLCVDPADPAGPPVPRPLTRVTEYALDELAGTATPVWNYEEAGRFAIFAGSAERLPDGHTLIGWASSRAAVATEVDADGDKVWELVDPEPENGAKHFTYRATRTMVPDAVNPVITLSGIADGASYTEGASVTPSYACTDRGGSSLRSCTVTGLNGTVLDTRDPGTHLIRITATDGSGNTSTITRSYFVRKAPSPTPAAVHRPDAAIRTSGGSFRGLGTVGSARRQTVTTAIRRKGAAQTFVVRVTNRGNRPERFRLVGTPGNRRFAVSYRVAATTKTGRIVRGTYRTPALRPGQSITVKIVVRRDRSTPAGAHRTIRLRTESTAQPPRYDVVAAAVRAKRR